MSRHASGFKDLMVYQKARAVAKYIFQMTNDFPKDELLTSQIRQSSRSIGAQIAEAWAKRRCETNFVSELTNADVKQQETQHWVNTAVDCGYLTDDNLNRELSEIGRMLNSMIEKADTFCGDPSLIRPYDHTAS